MSSVHAGFRRFCPHFLTVQKMRNLSREIAAAETKKSREAGPSSVAAATFSV
jgi:hypothetical protein